MATTQLKIRTFKISTCTYKEVLNNIEYLTIQKYCKATNTLNVFYLENLNNKLKLI